MLKIGENYQGVERIFLPTADERNEKELGWWVGFNDKQEMKPRRRRHKRFWRVPSGAGCKNDLAGR
jgi:hypothetical protein